NLDDACHTGACSATSGQCIANNKTNGTGCNDGNLCTTADQCTAGVCGGTTTNCSNLDDACHTGACSATSGQCIAANNTNGTTCSDGNLCTTAAQCTSGVCGGTTPNRSNLDDACHTGACSATSGQCTAVNRTNGTTCSDGNLCTTADQCTAGVCG